MFCGLLWMAVVCMLAGCAMPPGDATPAAASPERGGNSELPEPSPEPTPEGKAGRDAESDASPEGGTPNGERPNVILILTDDLDVRSAERMPRIRSLLAEKGTTFENAFVTNSVCCPSRATTLRGQYAHNHEVFTSFPPSGGFEKFHDLGLERSTVATWLDSSGYRTALMGKYLNGYCVPEYCDTPPTHVPPGWDEWYAWASFQRKVLNENGRLAGYPEKHPDDVLANEAIRFVQGMKEREQPFFMYLAPNAPHGPTDPAPRHRKLFTDAKAPRPPSFDEENVADKPAWLRDNDSLSRREVSEMDQNHRRRLRGMLSVDEMVGRLVETLEKSGELDDTYIFLTSDNGYHFGEHRLDEGKVTAYEEDIRVPFIVRGPGVPEGQTRPHMVLNNDLAPTFAALAGAEAPSLTDGRSLEPLLGDEPPPEENWRSAFLVEHWKGKSPVPRYDAVRTRDHLYVEYEGGGRELYDLRTDPHQLRSLHESADPALIARLEDRLDALRDCEKDSCRAAENRPVTFSLSR